MIDRQSVRDIALAVLLALPTAALTRPAALDSDGHPAAAAEHGQLVLADRSALQQRFTVGG
jgi:hypothetical protein